MKVETATENLLFSTLRIQTEDGTGTAFIVQHELEDGRKSLFLVSNKHVVADVAEGTMTMTRAERDENGNKRPLLGSYFHMTIAGPVWQWTGHPAEDVDVAALPFMGVIQATLDAGEDPFFKSISTELIPSAEELADLDVVENITFIGYPTQVFDRANNLPIVRRGTTATTPSVDYMNRPIFLVDASVFPGSSGSPVFLLDTGSWVGRHGMTVGSRVKLLGVLAAVFTDTAEGSIELRPVPSATELVVSTKQMIDLGLVFKAHVVVETIEECVRQFGNRAEQGTPSEDDAGE